MNAVKGFKDINFGMAAAENEKVQNPNLLIEGFLDAYGFIDSILGNSKYLVLGSKGSGKTAIASKLELLSERTENLFVYIYNLHEHFPYSIFLQLMDNNETPMVRYQNYWEFIILIAFLESFSRDKSSTCENMKLYRDLIIGIEDLGLIPRRSLSEMIDTIKGERFKLKIQTSMKGEKYSDAEKIRKGLDIIFNSLRKICYSILGKGKHLLVIDGLDDLLNRQKTSYDIISSLIATSERINRKFEDNHVNAKFVILCRTELFERLPGSNNNKIKQDHAIVLDWYQDARDPYSTNLVRLINLRAETSLGRKVNIFEEFIPPNIWTKRNDSTVKFLLDNTRYRPRDFIQLLNYIQSSTKGDKPTNDEILNGIRSYSINFLSCEIRDELFGFLSLDETNQAIQLLSLMNKPKFDLKELIEKKEIDNRFKSLDLMKTLNILFDCGAISNYRMDHLGREINTTKYRTPHVCFDPSENIKIHWGLVKALNLDESHESNQIWQKSIMQGNQLLASGNYSAARRSFCEIPKEQVSEWDRLRKDLAFIFNFDENEEEDLEAIQNRRGQAEWRRKIWTSLVLNDAIQFREEPEIEEKKEMIVEHIPADNALKEIVKAKSEDKGETLEKDTLKLLNHLFAFDESEDSHPLKKLRQQRRSAQFGHDIKLEFTKFCRAANNHDVRCLAFVTK